MLSVSERAQKTMFISRELWTVLFNLIISGCDSQKSLNRGKQQIMTTYKAVDDV